MNVEMTHRPKRYVVCEGGSDTLIRENGDLLICQ